MVPKPNARMFGWDCEPALCCPQTVCIPFTTNQNLSVFCANTKKIGCTRCPFHAPGVLSMHRVSFPCTGCPFHVPGVLSMHRVFFPCTRCSFHAPGVLCSLQVRGKLINHAPLTRRMRMAQRARVYKALHVRNFFVQCCSKTYLTFFLQFFEFHWYPFVYFGNPASSKRPLRHIIIIVQTNTCTHIFSSQKNKGFVYAL